MFWLCVYLTTYRLDFTAIWMLVNPSLIWRFHSNFILFYFQLCIFYVRVSHHLTSSFSGGGFKLRGSMDRVHGPGPGKGTTDHWSMFCPYPFHFGLHCHFHDDSCPSSQNITVSFLWKWNQRNHQLLYHQILLVLDSPEAVVKLHIVGQKKSAKLS